MLNSADESKRFKRLTIIATFSKLADELVSTKTTLPWLLTSIGAPSGIISALVPIRESGSLIPQWWIKQKAQHIENRLMLWRWGVAAQALCIGLMVLCAFLPSATLTGVALLLLLGVMSLGRALTSLTQKDIQGYSVSKGKRGKLNGLASSFAGVLSIFTAILLWLGHARFDDWLLWLMLLGASLLMWACILISPGLDTHLSPDDDSGTSQQSWFSTLKNDGSFKHLIISRCLLLHGALVAPFFVSFAPQHDMSSFSLPYFITASALASFVSSYIWGTVSDRSAVLSLRLGASICTGACVAYVLLPNLNGWSAIGCFFLLTVGYAGIRNGRKTYVLDIAEDSQRTHYVATGNTVVGVVLLILGGIYGVIAHYLALHIISVMAGIMIFGGLHTYWLTKEK